MTPPKFFDEIVEILEQYVPDPQIPLQFQDPYSLLIAVILSAQCTDRRVNEIMPKLLACGQTPAEIAALGCEKVTEIIKPCGLYTRKGPAIIKLSEILRDKYDGRVPHDRGALQALPGVGRKTANVILSHAFGEYAFPVDTHIMRLSSRWGWSQGKTPEAVEDDLCALFPPETWLRRHLQLILFGRTWCKAVGHKNCPACAILQNASKTQEIHENT